MTSPGENPLLDPDVFLRLKKPRTKLAAHDQLIAGLLQKGWTAYMIWRYLSEECQIVVSRTAVYNACVRLKEAPQPAVRRPSALSGTGLSTPRASAVNEVATTPVQTPSKNPVGGNLKTVPRPEPQPQSLETIARRSADQNDGLDKPVFVSKPHGLPPTIATPRHSVTRPSSPLMHRYDRDDPALVRAAEEEREFRRNLARDNQTITSDNKGAQDE